MRGRFRQRIAKPRSVRLHPQEQKGVPNLRERPRHEAFETGVRESEASIVRKYHRDNRNRFSYRRHRLFHDGYPRQVRQFERRTFPTLLGDRQARFEGRQNEARKH